MKLSESAQSIQEATPSTIKIKKCLPILDELELQLSYAIRDKELTLDEGIVCMNRLEQIANLLNQKVK